MKNKILKNILFFSLVLIPFKASALENNINIVCEKNKLIAGEKTTCQVVANTENTKINGVDFKLSFDKNLTVSNLSKDESWQGTLSDSDIKDNLGKKEVAIQLYTDQNKTGASIKIAKFDLVANKNSKPSKLFIKSVGESTISDEEFNNVPIKVTDYEIKVLSQDNTLKNITVDGKNVDKYDEKTNTYSYQVNSKTSSVIINAVANDLTAVVDNKNKTANLKYGDNKFTITVTSEAGVKAEYYLIINRIDDRSSEKDLLGIKFINHDIKFNKDVTEYNINVSNKINTFGFGIGKINLPNALLIDEESIEISPKILTAELILNGKNFNTFDSKKIVEKCNEDNTICEYFIDDKKIGEETTDGAYLIYDQLKEGKNTLVIKITAENETTKEYTFNIDRAVENIYNNPETGVKDYIVGITCTLLLLGAGYLIIRKYSKFPLK